MDLIGVKIPNRSLVTKNIHSNTITTLTLRHQSLREEKKENRTVILTFVVLRKD